MSKHQIPLLTKVSKENFANYNDESYSELSYLDETLPPHYDSDRRSDIERFIFSLDLRESITLLFLTLGFKRKEIAPKLGYKNVQNVTKIVLKMREACDKEQF